MCIIKPKAAEKGVAEIKKNEYQRNIKVTPRGPVLGQNICSLGAGQSCSSPLCSQVPGKYPALGARAGQSLLPPGQQEQETQPRAAAQAAEMFI